MKLSRVAFELLSYLAIKGPGKYTQKYLSEQLSVSVGLVNKLITEFKEQELIEVNKLTMISDKGMLALEPYKVKKAVILAAGFSERLAPITLETPKPLVKVNDIRIIDTLIDSLHLAGIEEICLVIGYKAEMFNVLLEKYPKIKLVHNELYNQSGNITSLYAALDEIESCYICDADLYIHNPSVIKKYLYSSCFYGVPVRETDDWCFNTNSKTITQFTLGGEECFRAVFISFISSSDVEVFKADLQHLVNSRGGKERFWFDVLFGNSKQNYNIEPISCYPNDISEIDLLSDLVQLDSSYQGLELK